MSWTSAVRLPLSHTWRCSPSARILRCSSRCDSPASCPYWRPGRSCCSRDNTKIRSTQPDWCTPGYRPGKPCHHLIAEPHAAVAGPLAAVRHGGLEVAEGGRGEQVARGVLLALHSDELALFDEPLRPASGLPAGAVLAVDELGESALGACFGGRIGLLGRFLAAGDQHRRQYDQRCPAQHVPSFLVVTDLPRAIRSSYARHGIGSGSKFQVSSDPTEIP